MNIKLTRLEKKIIKSLQSGSQLITSNESRTVSCANEHGHFDFSSRVFYRMHEKGIIEQESKWPFDYKLSYEWKNANI